METAAPRLDTVRRITLSESGEQFPCREDESLLTGMHRSGRKGIPVGCRGGGCGVCRVRICSGEYATRPMSSAHISAADRLAGEVLACRVFPRCDLQVEVIGPLRRRIG
ncbi:MAG TPA: 2Fe-2S iron-sulfur cluster-binding protein [Burkholderiaceae bacterium]|nr:2Fe-2S iron-sulfur cluster-binding protein [Burkholderiaceae bacterium]